MFERLSTITSVQVRFPGLTTTTFVTGRDSFFSAFGPGDFVFKVEHFYGLLVIHPIYVRGGRFTVASIFQCTMMNCDVRCFLSIQECVRPPSASRYPGRFQHRPSIFSFGVQAPSRVFHISFLLNHAVTHFSVPAADSGWWKYYRGRYSSEFVRMICGVLYFKRRDAGCGLCLYPVGLEARRCRWSLIV